VQGDNGIGGIEGYHASNGWNPATGWGSPDGVELLQWLRENR
jgi:hypothetical protein